VDTTNSVSNEYLRRRMSIAEINKIYAERVPGALWRVRYFRNSQAEEFAVTLKPDGSLHGFWHTLPEAAKGETLGKEEAVAIAEGFLREKKQIDRAVGNLWNRIPTSGRTGRITRSRGSRMCRWIPRTPEGRMPRIMPTLAWICIFLGTSRPITGRTSKFPMNSSASRMSSPYHGLC